MNKVSLAVAVGLCVMSLSACQNKRGADSSGSGIPGLASGMRTVYFEFDQSNISDSQVPTMQNNAKVMKSNNQRVVIEGHCDERGTNEYNLALGDRRATSASQYLMNLGVDPSRLSTVSYGEERPACAESTEECWTQNRRGEFRKN